MAWISSRPENVNSRAARDILIAKIGTPIGLAIHTFFLIAYWHLDQMVRHLFTMVTMKM